MESRQYLARIHDLWRDKQSCGAISGCNRRASSLAELHRDGFDLERYNRLHPDTEPKQAYVTKCVEGRVDPAIAATDYVRAFGYQSTKDTGTVRRNGDTFMLSPISSSVSLSLESISDH